ncbi:MAG: DUF6036 family nucleotidyltransferase [Planctomycetaceae bacterium]
MSPLSQAVLDFVDLFESRAIQYAIMGGLAARAHGMPRATFDVDFTISVERDDLPSLFDAAEDLGYTIPAAYRAGWVDQVSGMPLVKLGVAIADRSVDVDVFLAESPYLREVIKRRCREVIDTGHVWLVSPEDLIVLKVLSGRPRDRIDVQDVLFMQGELDRRYMRHWAEQLGVLPRLESALQEFDNG